jgi:hypothetical protein
MDQRKDLFSTCYEELKTNFREYCRTKIYASLSNFVNEYASGNSEYSLKKLDYSFNKEVFDELLVGYYEGTTKISTDKELAEKFFNGQELSIRLIEFDSSISNTKINESSNLSSSIRIKIKYNKQTKKFCHKIEVDLSIKILYLK